jgi:hypothetical protein
VQGDGRSPGKSAPVGRGPGAGEGRDRGGQNELTEDAILQEWAFATSPYGLGLSELRFWTITPREIQKLKDVWAIEQARYYNAHFHAQDGLAYLPEDFLGTGNREQRARDAARAKAEASMEARRLAMQRPTTKDGVPQWALETAPVVN